MQKLFKSVRQSQVWRSIFRHGYPDTPRNRTLAVLSNTFLKSLMAQRGALSAVPTSSANVCRTRRNQLTQRVSPSLNQN